MFIIIVDYDTRSTSAKEQSAMATKKTAKSVMRTRLAMHIEIAAEIPIRLKNLDDWYFGVSSLFLQEEAVDLAWLWIMDWASNVSGATYAWSKSDRPHRIHRLLLVRDPMEIENVFLRERFQYVLRTFCHLHMRDGVVLYVVFLSGAGHDIDDLSHSLNLSYFKSGLTFPLAGFWTADYKAAPRLTGRDAGTYVKECLKKIPNDVLRSRIMIWYDDLTFSNKRRSNDALWKANRKFIHKTFGGVCQSPRGGLACAGQADMDSGHVDHIIPIGQASNILLNLTWLCSACNLSKSDMRTLALPIEKASVTVPGEYATIQVLEAISHKPPAWLKLYREKPKSVLAHI